MIFKKILPFEQQKIYPTLSYTKDKDFILFGGTAIALQIGNRQSVDFDFFRKQEITSEDKEDIKQYFDVSDNDITQNTFNTLSFIKNDVNFSFFGGISYATMENSHQLDETLNLAKLDILFATKLKAICDRIEYKDYYDVASLIKEGFDIKEGMDKVSTMLTGGFSTVEVLKTLVYFEGGQLTELTLDDKAVLANAVKKYTKNNIDTEAIVLESLMREARKIDIEVKEFDNGAFPVTHTGKIIKTFDELERYREILNPAQPVSEYGGLYETLLHAEQQGGKEEKKDTKTTNKSIGRNMG